MKIKKQFQRHPLLGETNTQPSMTIPDQAYTVQEMQNRLSRGLPVTGQRVPMYDPETGPLPELHKMELTELMDLQKITRKTIDLKTEELRKQELKKQQEETEEYYRKKYANEKIEDAQVINDPKP